MEGLLCQTRSRMFPQVDIGDVAQSVEHLLCKQGVGGSSPLVSTRQATVGLPQATMRPGVSSSPILGLRRTPFVDY
jgi:hypothetical protein